MSLLPEYTSGHTRQLWTLCHFYTRHNARPGAGLATAAADAVPPLLPCRQVQYVFGGVAAAAARMLLWMLPELQQINSLGVERMVCEGEGRGGRRKQREYSVTSTVYVMRFSA